MVDKSEMPKGKTFGYFVRNGIHGFVGGIGGTREENKAELYERVKIVTRPENGSGWVATKVETDKDLAEEWQTVEMEKSRDREEGRGRSAHDNIWEGNKGWWSLEEVNRAMKDIEKMNMDVTKMDDDLLQGGDMERQEVNKDEELARETERKMNIKDEKESVSDDEMTEEEIKCLLQERSDGEGDGGQPKEGNEQRQQEEKTGEVAKPEEIDLTGNAEVNQCAKCKKEEHEVWVQCSKCYRWIGKECLEADKYGKLTVQSVKRKTYWSCMVCRDELAEMVINVRATLETLNYNSHSEVEGAAREER